MSIPFFSWEHAPTRNLEVDWLDARNICRRHCMDAVSLETPQVKQNLFISKKYSYKLNVFFDRKMSLSNKEYHEVEIFDSFGHQVVNVILLVVIVQVILKRL